MSIGLKSSTSPLDVVPLSPSACLSKQLSKSLALFSFSRILPILFQPKALVEHYQYNHLNVPLPPVPTYGSLWLLHYITDLCLDFLRFCFSFIHLLSISQGLHLSQRHLYLEFVDLLVLCSISRATLMRNDCQQSGLQFSKGMM